MLLNRFKGKQTALNSFLGEHPTISWIQQAMTGQHEQCFHTLQKLGLQETELVNKKKVIRFCTLQFHKYFDFELYANIL